MKENWLALDVRRVLQDRQYIAVKEFCEDNPAPICAEILGCLDPAETWEALKHLELRDRVAIFSYFDSDHQVALARILSRKEMAEILTEMPSDDRVDLLKDLSHETREAILPALAQAEREDIRRLFAHREGSAGSVMTSEYATIRADQTVAEAITCLRLEAPNKETIYVAFVIDDTRHLLGVISLKDLILAPPQQFVRGIMETETVFCRLNDDQEDAARKIQKFDLLALPVLDDRDIIVGIITHDDAIDVLSQEHTEDMEKLMAIAGSHEVGVYLKTSPWVHFKNRATWIVSLAALGLVSGTIIHSFENVLNSFMILALYMPMVADTGGNVGSQSATVIVRALAVREVSFRDLGTILWKEFQIAVLLSLILGVLSWGKVMFLSQGSIIPQGFTLNQIGVAIALALSFQVVTATLIGAVLPLLAVRFDYDPAVIASPALTTIVDITGLLLYFGTAKVLLGL